VGVSARIGSDGAQHARRELAAFALGVAAVLALAGALGLRDLALPGLYYDEAVQAVPAAEFVRGSPRPADLPGGRSVRVAGRWLPVRTLPYMGALKSQLLIPVFAAFGASAVSLRAATFGFGLAGLAFAMLFARRLLGARIALVAGLLLAVDPAFLFVSRHDWGSFALGFACRGAGLWLALAGFERGSAARLAGAGLLLGLGVSNKLDAAVPLAAAACAALFVAPGAARARLARPRELAALLLGLLLGAAAILPGALPALRFAGHAAGGGAGLAGELPEKLAMWRTLLDGTHFLRLLQAGGRFEALASAEGGAATLFAPALLASSLALALRLGRRRPWRRAERAEAFLLAALVLSAAALLALPGAARIHHAMNVFPLPHLVVACALVDAWERAGRGPARTALRSFAALALALLVASALRADQATLAEIRERGGRGRWSDALETFARELEAAPPGPVLSFDWGFHAPLLLLAPGLDLREPIWALRTAPPGTELPGTPGSVYLVQDPRYRVFPFGDELLAAVARLPEGAASVRRHLDRSGDVAFLSIRIDRPHRIVRGDRIEVVLE